MQKFSPKQIKDFNTYVKVQMRGRYNMFDPRAREATGLSKEEYAFVMDNYSELEVAAQKN